ncbi:NUDIX domain [Candidatus Rhabdochlamydia oedothoracis]|uniref:NUDIX domain n=1 Tax=Candidatus Rhabdochlamydia oedothoracis TaxID=2720720 RepID=A0ABX8V6A2_9BACT|nr:MULTISPECIES: NUDIX domain-containing protein [Rhabdochlamydia]KAG6559766.1 8-oxo-dGTP diphosphatase [Candidatus Rhabdochlamydia sp. W815]QYF48995.1 NUDIX domain [Candidatus Rhabdochlamydia oedothoracis]
MQRQFTATVYIIKDDKALLLMHPKFHKWLPPGGHLEENETPHECALREVLEETGLKIGFYQDEYFQVSHKNACSIPRPFLCLLEEIPAWNQTPVHQHIDFVFVGYPIKEGLDKEFSYRWFSKEEILKLKEEEIFPDVKQIISEIFNLNSFLIKV